ncbi:MAG TPA: hypothetical protein VGB73_14040 [Pyrinomonadaceae bacterium]
MITRKARLEKPAGSRRTRRERRRSTTLAFIKQRSGRDLRRAG